MPIDIVLVLAFDVDEQGMLPEEARLRVNKGVEVFNNGNYTHMLMAGKYQAWKGVTPAKTEAAAMRDFATRLGVPEESILLEESSRDTIGNAYFSRLLLARKRLGRIAVVTSDYHISRTRFIFQKVFGSKYRIKFIAVSPNYTRAIRTARLAKEEKSLKRAKDFFNGVRAGDTRKISKLIYTKHDVYPSERKANAAKNNQ